jgi:hypothetical protein
MTTYPWDCALNPHWFKELRAPCRQSDEAPSAFYRNPKWGPVFKSSPPQPNPSFGFYRLSQFHNTVR